MNKDEAIKSMREGNKLTHIYFTPDEWIKESGHRYEFEDGCVCGFSAFWFHRQENSWQNGWSVFKVNS